MKNIDYIITAKDYSKGEGADGTVIGRLKKRQEDWRRRGQIIPITFEAGGKEVKAFINQGAWIAACECGGTEFVDADEPIFFCWGCANRANGYRVRPLVFPENIKEIEAEILARPVDDMRGITDKDRAYLAQPLLVFEDEKGQKQYATRSWMPGETVEDLKAQNEFITLTIKEQEAKK